MSLLLLLAAPHAVMADAGDTFNFSLSRTQSYDDNLFRLSDETNTVAAIGRSERGDFYTQDSLRIDIDKTYSLQRFKFSINPNSIRYRRNSYLDNDPLNHSAAWLWQSGERLDGELTASRSVSQSSFGDFRQPLKSLATTEAKVASINYWLLADWYVGLREEKTHLSYSSLIQQESENETSTHEWNLRFKPAGDNTVAFRRRQTDGRFPNQQNTPSGLVDNSYQLIESLIDVRWTMSGASTFAGFLGQSQHKYRQLPERDFSGQTGRLNWSWQITGQTAMKALISREINGSSDALPSYSLTDTLMITPVWTPTAKTQFELNLQKTHRSFGGDPIALQSGLPKREDDTRSVSLTCSYMPAQQWNISLILKNEMRNSNYAGLSYQDKTLMGTAQFSF